MEINEIEWEHFEEKPSIEGWYAIQYCWDEDEGLFVDISYWNNINWNEDLPIIAWSSKPFHSKIEAKEWADKHDF